MTWTAPDIVIVPNTIQDTALAAKLAQTSGLSVVDHINASKHTDVWLLNVHNEQLSLLRPDGLSLAIDFVNGKALRRTREAGFKSQPLARALGLQKLAKKFGDSADQRPTVIDATAGLGIDGWMMASLNCSVRLIEESTVLSMMLEQAISTLNASTPEAEHLSVINANSVDYLQNSDTPRADIIYLDPMYPQSRNKALVKKGMQLLHELIGPDNNGPALLEAALEKGDYRVVVKRPKGAPSLAGTDTWAGQVTQISSPNTRYDVYHTANQL